MTDSPKPISPEFVRGVQWAMRAAITSLNLTGSMKLALESIVNAADVDPLAAAKERLGAWLAAASDRGWCVSEHYQRNGVFFAYLYSDISRMSGSRIVVRGRGNSELEAINAALDAAERSET